MQKRTPLLIIVAGYLLLGSLYAARIPAWQAPDEPAHYNVVRQLADGRLPIMEQGDYDETYRNEVVSSRFDPRYDISLITYEDWQPPLYYLLQTAVYQLSSGSLTVMRLVSVLLGAGVVVLAYGVALLLFPQREWVAWTTAVFVAFLPQHLAMMASVNNDALAELLIAAILILLIRWAQPPHTNDLRLPLVIGLLLGAGFLTKGTVYLMAPVAGVALLWRDWGRWRDLIRHGAAIFGPALLLGALWWGRNIAIYGGLDILGKGRHDAVVVGQIRTAEWITQYGLAGTVQRFVQTTFNSFWGQFGWMAVPMPGWVYGPLLLLTGTAVLGLLLAPFVWQRAGGQVAGGQVAGGKWQVAEKSPNLSITQLPNYPITQSPYLPFTLLILLFLLTVGLHVGYNLTFVQHQGRYLFPALIPIGVGVAVGLGTWVLLATQPKVTSRWPWLVYLLPIGLGLALAVLDVYALFRFIIPALSLG